MVESRNIITIFFGQFESQYVGSPFMVGGNQIYSAIIREKGIQYAKELTKVSHGVFHELPDYRSTNWKGWYVRDRINLNNKSIVTYDDFMELRNYNTPFIKEVKTKKEKENYNWLADYNRLLLKHRFQISNGKNGETIDAFLPNKLSFFVIGKDDVNLDYISLGAKRNLGFGSLKITDTYTFDINDLDFLNLSDDHKIIDTAKNGIYGIYNHAKYGYGEFKIEKWVNKNKHLIRFITPLCMDSTIEGSTTYDKLPSFIKSDNYRKTREFMWRKGKPETLYCIADGSVCLYDN